MMRSCLFSICLALALAAGCGGAPDPPPGEEEPAGIRNTVRWKTASELDNYGFDVYRSTREDGPFETINEQPIAGAGTVDVPQNYEYVDDTIELDTAYYYYVESISLSGEREAITPVFRAKPKPRPE